MNRLILIVVVLVMAECKVNEPVETQQKPSSNKSEVLEVVYDTTEIYDSISLE